MHPSERASEAAAPSHCLRHAPTELAEAHAGGSAGVQDVGLGDAADRAAAVHGHARSQHLPPVSPGQPAQEAAPPAQPPGVRRIRWCCTSGPKACCRASVSLCQLPWVAGIVKPYLIGVTLWPFCSSCSPEPGFVAGSTHFGQAPAALHHLHCAPRLPARTIWARRCLRMQMMIWAVGLRGAVAYGLALNLPQIEGESDEGIPAIESATLVIVVLSTLILGSATGPLLRHFDLQVGLPCYAPPAECAAASRSICAVSAAVPFAERLPSCAGCGRHRCGSHGLCTAPWWSLPNSSHAGDLAMSCMTCGAGCGKGSAAPKT